MHCIERGSDLFVATMSLYCSLIQLSRRRLCTGGCSRTQGSIEQLFEAVQDGEEIVVTERGRSVARIVPVKTSSLKRVLEPMLREGTVRWSGGKPRGASQRPVIRGRTLADMVKEDRR